MATRTLSPRQREVLDLAAKGYRNPEIAQTLGIGYETVKTYAERIRKHYGASTVSEAVALYRQEKLDGAAKAIRAAEINARQLERMSRMRGDPNLESFAQRVLADLTAAACALQ